MQLVSDIVASNKLVNTEQMLKGGIDHGVASSSSSAAADAAAANGSTLFPIILCIMYIIFKINQIYTTFNELMQSTRELFLDMVIYAISVLSLLQCGLLMFFFLN